MQFAEPYNSLYTEVIKPVAVRLGFDAFRADDVFRPGIILQDIIRSIAAADVIIAEVTPANPNVFYELGYAHAIEKPTVLLAEHPTDPSKRLPFDISGFRVIFYDDTILGKRTVETQLELHLNNIKEGRLDSLP
jgi:nucleoside 2-deoxyribosyltransferase